MTTRTNVQRLGRLLSRRLDEAGVSPDDGISVEELHRRFLPYHLCRSELGLTTKAEYDLLVLDLIAESGYVAVGEPRLMAAVRKERASPEPGISFLRRFASARLRLLDALAEEVSKSLAEPVPESRAAPRSRGGTGSLSARVRPAHPRRPSSPGPARQASTTRRTRTECWSCAKALPERHGLRYCPHCGVDQTYRPCGSCDAELEHDWAFCPVCGEPTGSRRPGT